MCFPISKRAKKPRQTVAWKVVTINSRGYLQSKVHANQKWQPGETVHRSGGPTTYPSFTYCVPNTLEDAVAYHGIYVYLDEKIAHSLCFGMYNVVLKVRVSPKDFLHRGQYIWDNGMIATYDKVYVPEDQPYIEWYD